MSVDRGTERIVRSWLEDGVTALPDRVLDAVLDDLPATPQRRPRTARRFFMSNPAVRYAAIAAAIVAVAVIGVSLLGTPRTGSPPSATPTPTASGTPVPAPTDSVASGPLKPGTYTIYGIGGTIDNVRFTVPAGWDWVDGWYLQKGGIYAPSGAGISFTTGDAQVYTDPCHWSGAGPNPPTRGTAASLVGALAAQPMRNATVPVDRNLTAPGASDGWHGKAVTVSVPTDLDLATCDGGQFRSWGGGEYPVSPGPRPTRPDLGGRCPRRTNRHRRVVLCGHPGGGAGGDAGDPRLHRHRRLGLGSLQRTPAGDIVGRCHLLC